METGKKVLNVLGILASILLSIKLVLALTVLPATLSALSLLTPQNLANAVTKIDVVEMVSSVIADSDMEIPPEQVQQLQAVLSSDAAKEIVSVYTQSVVDTLGGQTDVQGLTPDMLRQLVNENMDGITKALKESGGEFAEVSEQELAEGIQQIVDEQAEALVEMLPDPQELKASLTEDVLPVDMDLLQILQEGAVTMAKLILIAVVVVLSLLIFGCRFVQWRGLKWLGVDLLIAGLLSGIICGALGVVKELVSGLIPENFPFYSVYDSLFGTLSTGTTIRTVIMAVVAVLFLVGYILICSSRKEKEDTLEKLLAETFPEEQF